MLFVERTDPSAAVAHGVDALHNSLGSPIAHRCSATSANQLFAKRHRLGPLRRPRVDGLLTWAQQSFDSEPKVVYALSRKRIARLDQT